MPFAFPLVRRSRLVTLAGQLRQQADRIAALESDVERLTARLAESRGDVETLKGHVRDANADADRHLVIGRERLDLIKRLDAEADRLRESEARYRAFCDGLRDALNDGLDAPDDDHA